MDVRPNLGRDPLPEAPSTAGEVRTRAVRGGAATLVAQWAKFGLQLCSTPVLGRLLTPGDYGIVAMVTSITALLAVLRDAGLAAATVQKAEVTHEQVSTLFWINVALGAVLALITACLAPVLSWIYHEPRVVPVTAVLAGLFFLNALAVQHHALLRRQLRFKAVAVVEVASMAAGIAVAIGMAARGAAYWSLVGMTAVTTLVNVVLVWAMQRWRPGRPSRTAGAGSMLKFGGTLMVNNLMNYLFRNVDNLLIGWRWGADSLGIYSKAYGLLMLPIQQVNGPMNTVAVPALSRLQGQPELLKRSFLGGFTVIASVVFPILIGTFIFAEEIVETLLGNQWSACVELYRWLAPAALAESLSHPLGWLMWAQGRADRLLKIGILWSGFSIAGFAIGLPFGARGVAIGFSIATCVVAWPHAAYLLRGTPVRMVNLIGALSRPAGAALAAGAVGILFKQFGPAEWPAILRMIAGGAMVSATYAVVLLVVLDQWSFFRRLFDEAMLNRRAGAAA